VSWYVQSFSRVDDSLVSEVELPPSVTVEDLAAIFGDNPHLMYTATPLCDAQVGELARLSGMSIEIQGDCFLQFYK
jgi:hypothetical protein